MIRDRMLEKERKEIEKQAKKIQRAKDEASAEREVQKLKKDIALMQSKHAKALFDQIEKAKEKAKELSIKTADDKERMAPVTMKSDKPRRGWRPPVAEGINHQILTENFRNFVKAEE